MRLPIVGSIWRPPGSGRFDRGWYGKLFVSQGIGTSILPIRFLCRPEIAVIRVIPAITTLSAEAPHLGPPSAEASVSVLLSLDEMVAASSAVVVGTAAEKKSQWEELAGGKRIVTYTKIKIDRTLTGSAGSEVWVRTLGGSVDKIGQAVSGEAQIATGSKSVLFLRKSGDATVVTGMAQGHFPVGYTCSRTSGGSRFG